MMQRTTIQNQQQSHFSVGEAGHTDNLGSRQLVEPAAAC
jgi:hypothetical protein